MKQRLTKEWALNHLRSILGFWSENMIDHEYGGFYGRIDGDHQLHPEAPKGAILNARLLWTFSAAYQRLERPRCLEMSDRAFHYLAGRFIDDTHGGIYWQLDHEGRVMESKKQAYAQAFTIYGLSEYHKVRQEAGALRLAKELFQLLEDHCFDEQRNGYIEAVDRFWLPLEDVRLSDKDLNAPKTMNTHLHVLEAYTNLYGIWPDKKLGNQLKNLIELMIDRFVDENGHFRLFFSTDWDPLTTEVSYGHDIEGSWLLVEAAKVLDHQALLDKTKRVALKMVDASLRGLDTDGGLMNEGNAQGITNDTKDWWPQVEALVGLVNAWQIAGDRSLLDTGEAVAQFIDQKLLDPTGEWYWGVTREGTPRKEMDKAGFWKCPYHNGRAMLELIRRLG